MHFEQGALHFYFVLDPANFVACPSWPIHHLPYIPLSCLFSAPQFSTHFPNVALSRDHQEVLPKQLKESRAILLWQQLRIQIFESDYWIPIAGLQFIGCYKILGILFNFLFLFALVPHLQYLNITPSSESFCRIKRENLIQVLGVQ